jgi:hypothetical protein
MVYSNKYVPEAPNEELVSKINAAGLINSTLESLWRDVYSAMARGDFLKWNRKLDAIWLILGGEANSPTKEFNQIDLSLHNIGTLKNQKNSFSSPPSDYQEKRNKLYVKLREKALFLRKLQNSQGKGTAYASGDEDDFE